MIINRVKAKIQVRPPFKQIQYHVRYKDFNSIFFINQSNSVIWKNIEYNIGSAFDEETGIFTSPHDGIYSFHATSPVHGQYYGYVNIYVNGSEKVNSLVWNNGAGSNEYKHGSPYCVFKLNQGDTVHIAMSGTFYYSSSNCARTYFQGHMIDLL